MRLGGRLQAAIDILAEFERGERPVADVLGDWGAAHRFAGSGDRAAIGNLVHDALRRRRSAAAMLGADTARAAVLGAFLIEHHMTPEALDAALDGDRFAPQPLSAGERQAVAGFVPENLPDAVRADVPDWCVPQLAASFGEAWPREAAALASRPPLDLRVNRLKAGRDEVLAALAGHGARAAELSPDGVRIAPVEGHGRHPNLAADPAFRDGLFEVQDEGSQLAALFAACGNPAQILDYCAGAGGKTLALSALLGNRGQIFAHDADRRRLRPIRERLLRAGCRNVQLADSAAALGQLAGRMDLVLVDAPCTGSGTWRRRPDSKWRLTPEQLALRMAEQDAILAASASFVRPGGWLAYVTCSLFAAENEERIDAFRAGNGEFSAVAPDQLLARTGIPAERVHRRRGALALSPLGSGTDGFFIAVLARAA